MGDRPRSGVLLSLSITVILGAGDCSVLGLHGPAGGRSELLDLDLDLEVCLVLSITLDGCYTSGISSHKGTGIATAAALLWSLPHNGTR